MLEVWFTEYTIDLPILGLRTLSTIPDYAARVVINN